ncbi:hypothetical protein F7725_020702 [Dissostichus mawsoni]|uniref:Uncharacterized protein n=1 Tax=Dissostichus mawsoni TaxID=36200 RepID=A0A7J5YDY1_DISMA|nr:hypothetical protein F7725_020702 [Dissostichus mawsoni]
MVWNLSDLCAAVSALITLARRKLRKVSGSRKVTPLGMGGPKGGTSFILVTAALKGKGTQVLSEQGLCTRTITKTCWKWERMFCGVKGNAPGSWKIMHERGSHADSLFVSSCAAYLLKSLRSTCSPSSSRKAEKAGDASSLLYISSSVLWPARHSRTPTFLRSCSVTLGVLSASLRQEMLSSGTTCSRTSLSDRPRTVPCFPVVATESSKMEPRRVTS